MKRIAILTLFAMPAFAHEKEPETKFFQEQLKNNPMIQNVLTWCSLIGLENEDDCKNEMYKNGDTIDPIRLEAATKCVDKSGIKHRVAFDNFFKVDPKGIGLISDPDINGDRHLYPANGPKGSVWEKKHYYYYTAVDKQMSSMAMGNEFVTSLKNKTAEILTTWKAGGEIAVGAKISPEFLTAKLGEVNSEIRGLVERAVTEGRVTQELLNEASRQGEDFGRKHPEATGRRPSGSCFVGGQCTQIDKQFPESQLQVEVNKILVPKSEESGPKVIVI